MSLQRKTRVARIFPVASVSRLCRKYYFSETITGTEVVIILLFQSALRARTYETGVWWNRTGENDDGEARVSGRNEDWRNASL